MLLAFRRRMRHPFYPALKTAPAAEAKAQTPSLTGTFAELSQAAAAGVQVDRAVFPLHSPSRPFLSGDEREALWEMFEVPVLAMLVDDRGAVVGYECELQDGFHLREDFTGAPECGRVESSLCECGRPGPRLMPPDDAALPEMVSLASAAD